MGSLLLVMIFLLSACGNNHSEPAFWDYQRGFMRGWGNMIMETPDGYYFLEGKGIFGEYLVFMDDELKESSIVCSKPECLHENESDGNKENCDAYFFEAKAMNYYDGKIYVLADGRVPDLVSKDAIYELEIDGSNRKQVYLGDGSINTACIHQGNMILYESKYIEGKKNPTVSITKFPVKQPSSVEVLYETSNYEEVTINWLECYQNYCYFILDSFDPDNTSTHGIMINLDTNEVKDLCDIAEHSFSSFVVGKDCLYISDKLEENVEKQTWKRQYYECSLDGEKKRVLTEDDFEALARGAGIIKADDQYVYLQDISYGGNAAPIEEQKYYIYTYDGRLMGTISHKDFSMAAEFISGNDRYLFIREGEAYYKVDKRQFGDGKELVPELILV